MKKGRVFRDCDYFSVVSFFLKRVSPDETSSVGAKAPVYVYIHLYIYIIFLTGVPGSGTTRAGREEDIEKEEGSRTSPREE